MSVRPYRLFLAFIWFGAAIRAESIHSSKYGMEFYRAGVGARAEGLGNANAAVARDVTAIYWNPAGLASLSEWQGHATHSERFAGAVNVDFLGAAVPFSGKAAIGFGIYRLGVDGIPITRLTDPSKPIRYLDDSGAWQTNKPVVDHTVDDQEFTFILSYARLLNRRFAYGINLKSIHKALETYSAWGLGLDFGIQFNPYRNLQVGAVLKDATATFIAWRRGETEWIRPRLRLGSGIPFTVSRVTLMPVLDVEMGFDRAGSVSQLSSGAFDCELHAGLEARYEDRIALRAGSNGGRFTAGAGFRFSVVCVDYSFSSHPDLGAGHRVSATLIWDRNRLFRF